MFSDFHLQRPFPVQLIKAQASPHSPCREVQVLKAELRAGSSEHAALWDCLLSASFHPEMKGLCKRHGSRSTKGAKRRPVPTVRSHVGARLGLRSGPLLFLPQTRPDPLNLHPPFKELTGRPL